MTSPLLGLEVDLKKERSAGFELGREREREAMRQKADKLQ